MMNPDGEKDLLLLQGLIDAFEKLEVGVNFARLSVGDVAGKGGLAKVGGKKILVIDRDLSTGEMCELLASELARMDVEGLFLAPIVRDAVDKYRGK